MNIDFFIGMMVMWTVSMPSRVALVAISTRLKCAVSTEMLLLKTSLVPSMSSSTWSPGASTVSIRVRPWAVVSPPTPDLMTDTSRPVASRRVLSLGG